MIPCDHTDQSHRGQHGPMRSRCGVRHLFQAVNGALHIREPLATATRDTSAHTRAEHRPVELNPCRPPRVHMTISYTCQSQHKLHSLSGEPMDGSAVAMGSGRAGGWGVGEGVAMARQCRLSSAAVIRQAQQATAGLDWHNRPLPPLCGRYLQNLSDLMAARMSSRSSAVLPFTFLL